MNLEIDVQYAVEGDALPAAEDFETWAAAALAGRRDTAQLSIRIVDEGEGVRLNGTYRGRKGATNVLSFPYDGLPGVDVPLLGDIVICAPVVIRQTREQHKPAPAHWAHMVVHGTLHLLGYDHIHEAEAQEMETLERNILAGLGFDDPY